MNNCNFVGKLVRDPELRYTANGIAIVKVALLVQREMSAAAKAEARSKGQATADFINLTGFGKPAELLAGFVAKGHTLAVTARYKEDKLTAEDGSSKYIHGFIIEKFTLVGESSKPKNEFDESDFADIETVEDDEDIPF